MFFFHTLNSCTFVGLTKMYKYIKHTLKSFDLFSQFSVVLDNSLNCVNTRKGHE